LRYLLKFEKTGLLNKDQLKTVESLADRYNVDQLTKKMSDLGEAEKWIDANVNLTLIVTDTVGKMVSN